MASTSPDAPPTDGATPTGTGTDGARANGAGTQGPPSTVTPASTVAGPVATWAPGASASTTEQRPLTSPAAPGAPAPTAGTPGGTAASNLPGVASQLVSVVSPLRAGADGTRSISVALHPAELGDVRVAVTTTDETVVVRLAAATEAGHDALRQSLPDLQQHLSGDAARTTVVLADAGGGDPDRGSSSPGPPAFSDGSGGSLPSSARPAGSGVPATVAAPGTGSGAHLLDVRL
jgi:hypothetical protein